jgi:hypothetical protein
LSYAAADTTMVHVSFPAADPPPDDPLPDDTSPDAVSSETKAMHACAASIPALVPGPGRRRVRAPVSSPRPMFG